MWKGDHQVNTSTYIELSASLPWNTSAMCNRWMVLTLAYLIAATTAGIVTTNDEETEIFADGEDEISETPFGDSNGANNKLRISEYLTPLIKDPPPIQRTRAPTSDPCGTPKVQCLCPNSPYSPMDGTCYNLNFTTRGSAGSAFSRLQKGRYANANGDVITRTVFGPLPLPRVLSYNLFTDRDVPDRTATNAVVAWGQMVAHDGSFIQEDGIGPDGQPIQCCTQDAQMLPFLPPKCFPISIPPGDPFYSQFNVRCLEMRRTMILNTTGCSAPEINQISTTTQHLDLSHIYGNSNQDVSGLRSFVNGQLKTKVLPDSLGGSEIFLPQVATPVQNCFVASNSDTCYKSGDIRVNQNLGLVVFQTLIVREHNRIAKELFAMHPDWSDETLFQEARRISIAQYLYITYNEFLPLIIGQVLMQKLRLASPKRGYSNLQSPDFDGSTMAEFSAAAFRSLHGLVPEYYDMTNEARCPFSKVLLKDIYADPGVVEVNNNFDALSRGFASQASQSPDVYFTNGVTEFLLKRPSSSYGGDLESFDIQRGRDQGLPTYNDMRQYCGLPRATTFDDLLDLIPVEYVNRLKVLYSNVNDIDFFVGGMLESRGVLGDNSALVGYTFGCVIGEQFWRWKQGNRYFYDFRDQAGSFTLRQINGIKNTSLAAFLCENLSIENIQPSPFLQVSTGNPLLLCKDVPRMDLSGFLQYTPNNPCGGGTLPI